MESKICIRCAALLPVDAIFCPKCGKKQVHEKRKALKRANGTGSVYKLTGRRRRPWIAVKNKVVIGYYEKKTDALEALEHFSGRVLTQRYNMTFSDIYAEWSVEHFKTIGRKGIEAYENSYRIFTPLHNQKFRELRTADFQEILNQHWKKSSATLAKYKQLITQMSNWAIREEIVLTNFAKFVNIPKMTKHDKDIFTVEEIEKFEKDGSETAKIILMLLSTGMRIGELFYLPITRYYKNYVIGGSKTEAGRNRIIPIRPEGREHFSYFASRATGPLLLSGYSGQRVPANFRQRDYYPLLEKLKIKKKPPHTTRHTYATRAIREGLSPEILQEVLGHADYSTTVNFYNHFDVNTLISAVDQTAVANSLLTNPKSNKKEKP